MRVPRWTGWAFYGLVAMLIALLACVSLIRIERSTLAVPAEGGGVIVGIVPASRSAGIAHGDVVRTGSSTASVLSVSDRVLSPAEVAERFGVEVDLPSIAVTTSASVEALQRRSLEIVSESEPAIVALIPGLSNLLGGGDA